MKKHRFNIFPEMGKEDYQLLFNDIKDNGYDNNYPIILFEDKILDGWNRYRVIDELNIPGKFEEFKGTETEALQYVLRSNKRRNLTSLQWACIANDSEEIIKLIREKVKEEGYQKREAENQYTKVDSVETFPQDADDDFWGAVEKEEIKKPIRTSEILAETFNTNDKYINKMAKLKNEEPDLFELVKNGEMDLKDLRNKDREDKKNNKILQYNIASKEFKSDDIKLYMEDFYEFSKTIPDHSIDAIITDPPYPEEYLPLWEKLFEISPRILKPSGLLIAYSGHMYLDKIFRMKNDLLFYWQMKLDFSTQPIVHARNFISTYKPVLIFQNPPFKKMKNCIQDVVKEHTKFNYEDRTLHQENWGQAIGNFEYLIEQFTNPGDLIFEPFAGTGTTLLAAQRMKRKCIGCELDPQYETIIAGRLVKNE